MNYISTRGNSPPLGFQDAVMTGLGRDGGLFLPAEIPDVRERLTGWRRLVYTDLAYEIIRLYADLPETDLQSLIARSYAVFRHPAVTPVVPVRDFFLLELYHGPTLAFKDIALQFLGRLFEYTLTRTGRELNLLAATSGDTGSAAICGVRGRSRMRIFVLYPHGRVSPAQERQMITVPDANVFTLAVEGSFDDCQAIVKTLFGDLEFRDRMRLGAVNSINWARLLAQIVYYFYAAFQVMNRTGCARVRFAVPTGNFGDIFAGILAARMGLPIGRLILAANENDILARFFNTGIYRRSAVRPTISPSMDIQAASNFERYLYYRVGADPRVVCRLMDQFNRSGQLTLTPSNGAVADDLIGAGSSDTAASLETIRAIYETTGTLIDPHTAVGVKVSQSFMDADEPMICLATAHPAKFSEAICRAIGQDLARHELLEALKDLPVRRTVVPASVEAVRQFVEKTVVSSDSNKR